MPLSIPYLFCTPADLFDFLGTEGAMLALDDHNLATGQNVTATADAVISATSISVVALTNALLRGDTLEFDGGGMDAVVQAQLSAAAAIGATTISVSALSAQINSSAAAFDTGVNVALASRLLKGCRYGTSRVKLYCQPRYDDVQLANSWSVNQWATIVAARWVRTRRAQSAPKSIEDDYKETMEELKGVRRGLINIEDIAPRSNSGAPFLTNLTVDIGYTVKKLRVEPQISDAIVTQYPQSVDWSSIYLVEF